MDGWMPTRNRLMLSCRTSTGTDGRELQEDKEGELGSDTFS